MDYSMDQLPTTPAPSGINLSIYQPSAGNPSVSGKSQSRSSGIHLWSLELDYSLLEFDERNTLMAFLASRSGRVVPFEVYVPTYSENNEVTSATAACDGAAAIDSTSIRLRNVSGKLKDFNLISVNGYSKVYTVSNPSTVVGGIQTVTITPPLQQELVDGDIWNVKDVKLVCKLEDDKISANSKGMSASLKINLVEEL